MKKFLKTLIPGLCVLLLMFTISCDDDSVLNETAFVVQTDNVGGGEKALQLSNGKKIIINDNQTFFLRRRTSCSGSDPSNVGSIGNGDKVTYFFTKDDADFANRTMRPFEVHSVPLSCLTAGSHQFVLDSDFDGVGDVVDADPNDPNVQ